MLQNRKATASVALLAGLALTAAACGSSKGNGSTAGGSTSSSGSNGKTDLPGKTGGTLKLLGAGDVDHLDPTSSYYTVGYTVLRADSRQLVSYPNASDPAKANVPVPDIADGAPTVSSDGLTYTFKIKQGVKWDAPSGARQVTAQDEVRGIKRICNPVQPSGATNYYTATIVGMQAFCDGYAKVTAGTPAALAAYQNSHDIAGVKAMDDATVVFTLKQPAGDFLNILALPFASPAPVEYDKYVPDDASFRKNFISDGPYKISSYVANSKIVLDRNPAWVASTDTLRHAFVDKIDITEGTDEAAIQQQLEVGTADMEFDTGVPTQDLEKLIATSDPKLSLQNVGSTSYVVFNYAFGKSSNGAVTKLAVRKALQYCVAKSDIIQVLGGPRLYQPIDQILTPPILGYKKIDPYNNLSGNADYATGKSMLAAAGYPNGLSLTYLYRNKGKSPKVFAVLQNDMAKCGVKLNGKAVTPSDFYTKHLSHPAATKSGDWDLAAPGWNPDWQGNAARSFFVPLLDGRTFQEGTTNYGDYNNDAVNKGIDDALSTTDLGAVANKWAAIDAQTMADAPWLPLVTGSSPYYRGPRVHNWVFFNFSDNADPTNVWLG